MSTDEEDLSPQEVASRVVGCHLIRSEQEAGTQRGLLRRGLGVVAEFEANLRRERQREGVAPAKARGIHTGRVPRIDPGQARGPSASAKRLGIACSPMYRFGAGRK